MTGWMWFSRVWDGLQQLCATVTAEMEQSLDANTGRCPLSIKLSCAVADKINLQRSQLLSDWLAARLKSQYCRVAQKRLALVGEELKKRCGTSISGTCQRFYLTMVTAVQSYLCKQDWIMISHLGFVVEQMSRFWKNIHFRLHRMPEMLITVTDDRGVCLSVCLSRGATQLHCTKTAERIEILFGVNTLGSPRNIVLDRVWSPTQPSEENWGKFRPLWTPYISQEWLKIEI